MKRKKIFFLKERERGEKENCLILRRVSSFRLVIEEELEILYDAYFKELENNGDSKWLQSMKDAGSKRSADLSNVQLPDTLKRPPPRDPGTRNLPDNKFGDQERAENTQREKVSNNQLPRESKQISLFSFFLIFSFS